MKKWILISVAILGFVVVCAIFSEAVMTTLGVVWAVVASVLFWTILVVVCILVIIVLCVGLIKWLAPEVYDVLIKSLGM